MRLTVDRVHIARVPVEIPPEVLGNICSYLDKLSIKSVRQVCRTFNFAASPYLFTRAHTSPHPFDHDILLKVSQHPVFCKSVRELVCHVRQFDVGMTNREEYIDKIKTQCDGGASSSERISGIDLTQAVIDKGFEMYCRHYRQQEESKIEEAQLKCLLIILPRMRNIQALRFGYTWGIVPSYFNQRGICDIEEDLPLSPLIRSWNPQHLYPRSRKPLYSPMAPQEIQHGLQGGHVNIELPVIIKALSQENLNTRIKSLDIGQDGECTDVTFFFDKYLPLEQAPTVFGSLTHLNISVPTVRMSVDFRAERSPLSQLLSATYCLEFLALSFDDHTYRADFPYISLKKIIGPQTFRELRYFSLGALSVAAHEMLEFLNRHQGSLRDLRLNQTFRDRATWADFLDSLGDLGLALKSCEIDLEWGFDSSGVALGQPYTTLHVSSARIMSFLEGDGQNPLRLDLK